MSHKPVLGIINENTPTDLPTCVVTGVTGVTGGRDAWREKGKEKGKGPSRKAEVPYMEKNLDGLAEVPISEIPYLEEG